MQKYPTRSWFNVGVISLSHFVGDYYLNILPVLLPVFALKFGFSYGQCGLLYMVFQLVASFIQAPIGLAADKRNLGLVLPLSVLTAGVLSSAVGLCTTPLMLVIIVFLTGLCSSGFHPVSGGILPNVTPKGHEVLATSFFIAAGNIGFALAPLISAWYLEYFTPSDLIYMAVLPVLTAVIIFARRLYIRELPQGTKETLSIGVIISNRDFRLLVLSIGLRAVCYCSLVIYIPLLYSGRGISPVSAAAVLTTLLTGTAAGGLITGALSTKFNIRALIVASYILAIASLGVFLYFADASLIAFASVFILGAALYGSTPAAIVWAQKLLPRADSFATSMMLGFTFGIGYGISYLVGVIADFTGLYAALLGINLTGMMLALVTLLMIRKRP